MTGTIDLSAKIVTELLLGRVKIEGSDLSMLRDLRSMMVPIRRVIGQEGLEQMVADKRPMFHVVVDALFDAAVDVESPETAAAIKNLPMLQRAAAEALIAKATGKTESGRMVSWLWSLRTRIDKVCACSLTQITPKDIRAGYHDLLHKVVDNLCDEWRVFAQ